MSTVDRTVDVLVVGGGMAGATTAATLRQDGFTGSILVAGREPDPPYHRPPATKGYLRGAESRTDSLIHPPDWWESNDVELRTRTNVLELDPVAKTAKVSGCGTVSYEHAALATGAMVRRLRVDGAQLEGLHYIRVPANADAVRRDAESCERVVLIGGSYVGCEVAATLTHLGKRCAIVMLEDHPLERQFGTRAGEWFRSILEARGIEVHGGRELERLEGDGRIQRVVAGGLTLDAGMVVAGVGAQPDVMLARKAGLPIGSHGGVRCDERLRVKGFDSLYAGGDMCEYDSVLHGSPIRVEHEEVARAHGETIARGIMGSGAPHAVVPYFFSDLADWVSLEYVGPALSWDQEVVQGEPANGDSRASFAIWYLERGAVRAMLSVNGGGDVAAASELIASKAPLDAAAPPVR